MKGGLQKQGVLSYMGSKVHAHRGEWKVVCQ